MQVSCGKKVQFKACFPLCKDKQTVDTEDDQEQAETQTEQKHQNVETGYHQSNTFASTNPVVGLFTSPNPNVNFNLFANFNPFANPLGR